MPEYPGIHSSYHILTTPSFQQGTVRSFPCLWKTGVLLNGAVIIQNSHEVFGGSGLGLFVSRQLAALMGGRIDVSSEIGMCGMYSWVP